MPYRGKEIKRADSKWAQGKERQEKGTLLVTDALGERLQMELFFSSPEQAALLVPAELHLSCSAARFLFFLGPTREKGGTRWMPRCHRAGPE